MRRTFLSMPTITAIGFALAVFILLAPQSVLAGGSCDWNGSADNDWFNPDNWTGSSCNYPLGGPPGPDDSANIPSIDVINEPSLSGSVTVLNLSVAGGRTLTASGQLFVKNSFSNQGTVEVGGRTLDIAGGWGGSFYNSGRIIGDGIIRAHGPLSLFAGEVFSPTLELVSGTTTVSGVLSGPLEVDLDATLDLLCASPGTVARADAVVNGTITGSCTIWFLGEEITNNGVIKPNTFLFDTGTHTLTGAGKWQGVAVYVEYTSTLQLANDVTLEAGNLFVDSTSSLDLMGNTLALSGTVRFDHQGFTGSNGLVRTQGNIEIWQSNPTLKSSFKAPLLVSAGTTTPIGGFDGPIEVSPDAVLTVPCCYGYGPGGTTAYGDVTVMGSLTGDGPFYFSGETFTNEGMVSIHYVDFQGGGTQWISGTGQWTGSEVRIESGSRTTLANDVTLSTSELYVVGTGAELDVASHTLTLEGDLRFDQRGRVKGSGSVRTKGALYYSAVDGAQEPVLEVSQGICTIDAYTWAQFSSIQVSSDAQLVIKQGSTLDISGDWISHGESQFESGTTIAFNGGKLQILSLEMPTEFSTLKVGSGTTLVENLEPDNATVAGTLTNNGTIRKTKSVVAAGALTFGLTNVGMEIIHPGTLGVVQIDRTDSDAPAATAGVQTGRHWTVTPNVGATGYNLTMTLPHDLLNDPTVCRYEGDCGWDCVRSTFTSTAVTRSTIAELSDWAVGNDIQPATAPTEVMSTDGVDVALAWVYQAADVEGYEVWYSLDPYFAPGDPGSAKVTLPQSETTFTHEGAAGNTEHNYAYLVLGVNGAGVQSASAQPTGEFGFALVAGRP